MKNNGGHTSATILNSCTFKRYRLLYILKIPFFKTHPLIAINKLFTYYVIHIKGRRGKAKYNECIIDGGGGLKTV